jgi:hypothetical protein
MNICIITASHLRIHRVELIQEAINSVLSAGMKHIVAYSIDPTNPLKQGYLENLFPSVIFIYSEKRLRQFEHIKNAISYIDPNVTHVGFLDDDDILIPRVVPDLPVVFFNSFYLIIEGLSPVLKKHCEFWQFYIYPKFLNEFFDEMKNIPISGTHDCLFSAWIRGKTSIIINEPIIYKREWPFTSFIRSGTKY